LRISTICSIEHPHRLSRQIDSQLFQLKTVLPRRLRQKTFQLFDALSIALLTPHVCPTRTPRRTRAWLTQTNGAPLHHEWGQLTMKNPAII
jgi:hypothetical protein